MMRYHSDPSALMAAIFDPEEIDPRNNASGPIDPPGILCPECSHIFTRDWLISAAAKIVSNTPGAKRGRKPHGSNPEQIASLAIMRKLRALGKSYDDIAEILNHGKHRTSTGALFIGASVCRILKREGFSGDSRTIRKGIANAEHAGRD
jgi:hypothetical protein